MKHISDMRTLLDRYWDGETTLEEERRIKAFFAAAGNDLPEEFRQEAKWFNVLQHEKSVLAPGIHRVAFASRRMWWYGIAAAVAVVICAAGMWWRFGLPQPSERVVQHPSPGKNISREIPEPPVVASVPEPALETASSVPVAQARIRKPLPVKSQPEGDTCDDPEQALAEIRAALALVSSKINKSKETLDKGLQEVDHVDILLKRKNG